MREAFVLRLAADSEPEQRRFIGWIEEVDTGREFHFRSTDDLLKFLAECTEDTRERTRSSRQDDPG